MASITNLFIAIISAFTFMQIEVHTFSTSQSCIADVVNLVKEKHSELSTDLLLSNEQSSDSLRQICDYYAPHKVHKVLQLVNGETCNTKIPSRSELEESIYDSYIQLLNQLRTYEGRDIPNSFGQHCDYVVGMTKATFDRTAGRLAGICLHKNAEEIE